jgi:hypothetical protein
MCPCLFARSSIAQTTELAEALESVRLDHDVQQATLSAVIAERDELASRLRTVRRPPSPRRSMYLGSISTVSLDCISIVSRLYLARLYPVLMVTAVLAVSPRALAPLLFTLLFILLFTLLFTLPLAPEQQPLLRVACILSDCSGAWQLVVRHEKESAALNNKLQESIVQEAPPASP